LIHFAIIVLMAKERAILIKRMLPTTTEGRPSHVVTYEVEGRSGTSVFNLTSLHHTVFQATPKAVELTPSGGLKNYKIGVVVGGLGSTADVSVLRGSVERVSGEYVLPDMTSARAEVELGNLAQIEEVARVAAAAIETPLSGKPEETPETFQPRLIVTLGRTRMSPPAR
jgi:hypothetical protein